MNKRDLWIYRIATALLTVLMLISSSMYIFAHDFAAQSFTALGIPTWIIYPLAIAKILGLVAIWSNKSATLREWAYAGFVFCALLAVGSHVSVGDGEWMAAFMGIILAIVSYSFGKKVLAAKG